MTEQEPWQSVQCTCGGTIFFKHTKRKWVGLTDDDYEQLLESKDWGGSLIQATEAKLREKNG